MTTKKSGNKKAKEMNEVPETVQTEEVPKALTAGQIELRNALAKEFFGVDDYTTLETKDLERIEVWAKKMKVPRAKKEKAPKEPKRTAGRKIAPTLRVVDEDAILRTIYGLKAIETGESYKGGWGEVTPEVEVPTLIAGLQKIVDDRGIVDDTKPVE